MDRTRKIIYGYTHELELKYNKVIPAEIINIIIFFYGFIINYVGHFLKANAPSSITIESDKLTIKGCQSAKLDKALPVLLENSNIYKIWRWRATVSIPKQTISSYGYCLMFGVISNQCTKFNEYPDDYLVDSYGICIKSNYVFKGKNNLIKTEQGYKGFDGEDVIRMEYEIASSNKSTLSFYNETKNGNFLYSMHLPQSKEITNWYPAFSLWHWKEGYIKVIPYDE